MAKAVRMISTDGTLYILAVNSADIVEKARRIHKLYPVTTAALGRLLTGASMMGAVLKGKDDSLTLRINGGGPAGSLIAVSDSFGNVKGYAENPDVQIPHDSNGNLDVGTAVGTNGTLAVMKDLGMKEPYSGQVPIISGEIANEITSYYALSEQTPTVCALGVKVDRHNRSVSTAGGFMIQLLPTALDDTIDKVEQCLKDTKPVTEMLSEGKTPEEICRIVLSAFELELLDEFEPEYRCDCSKERVTRALLTLNKDELANMADDEQTEVCCHFCEKKYYFTPDEIRALAGI